MARCEREKKRKVSWKCSIHNFRSGGWYNPQAAYGSFTGLAVGGGAAFVVAGMFVYVVIARKCGGGGGGRKEVRTICQKIFYKLFKKMQCLEDTKHS